jgi:hypothetical protein
MATLLRKALALGFILAMSGSSALVAEGGGVESARVRQTTLETLLTSRRALYKAKVAYLSQLDAQAHELAAPDQISSPEADFPPPEKVAEMIRRASRRQLIDDERMRTLQGMLELATEISSLQGELKKVKSDLESAQQVMDGRWVISFMPSGTRGDFFLSQSGTLLSGDYVLENGQSGSLVGTFVNNGIFVERIDAKYGKMGRIEGPLSKDRQSVRGTWLNYDPTSGQQITGSFTLDRVQEDREP